MCSDDQKLATTPQLLKSDGQLSNVFMERETNDDDHLIEEEVVVVAKILP